MLATKPGGVPLGPSFFSTITSPSSMVVLTQRSSTSLKVENALGGTAERTIRITLTMSGLRISSSLKSRAATSTSCESSPPLFLPKSICWLSFMAPRPIATATARVMIDRLFIPFSVQTSSPVAAK